MFSVEVTNFDTWRAHTRALLQRKIAPNQITWLSDKHSLSLFNEPEPWLNQPIQKTNILISHKFMRLAETIACHRDINRWALLYTVAYKLVYEDKHLLNNITNNDIARLQAMQKAISRDKHKMKAFVRFKKANISTDNTDENEPINEYFYAWFEPEHNITKLLSAFFIKRFHSMYWSILTPDCCMHWNKKEIFFTEGVQKPPKEEDPIEALWLTYYSNIFNPARLKLKAMQSEMPKKYWKNLPEAPLIAKLVRGSAHKTQDMLTKQTTSEWSKTEKSKLVKSKQQALRLAASHTHSLSCNNGTKS